MELLLLVVVQVVEVALVEGGSGQRIYTNVEVREQVTWTPLPLPVTASSEADGLLLVRVAVECRLG